ncbi:MAG TPA: helix-hairpin-helix domain-containing protein, partial [Candidatus Absconditabacterales bacterium]|nr:helix-hairpin-helix domain-containing protein [Candidatus Absconditabacterales bacterium]
VSEAGASVYSASALANKEYPDLDVTVRGAISIAHRIQDPLAELIKIDPKSIGVGQYQHDVDQKMLKEMLEKKIEDTVNRVGVDVNTASVPLLTYISGLNAKAAQAIVDWRDEHGPFADRKAIKKVKGVGPKAYEQAIGFLRVKNSKEPLDATGIHPESYEIIYSILEKEFQIGKKNLVLPYDLGLDSRKIAELAGKYGIGEDTLTDSINELARPGLDPRKEFDTQLFRNDVLDIKDLQVGMKLTGVVRNITDFGAFVDIGLHNDGLVHKSQMANYYVENPMDVVAVGKTVEVIVLSVDYDKEKVSLTMRTDSENNQKSPAPQRSQEKFQVSRSESTQKTQSSDEKLGDSGMRGNIVFR